MCVRERVKVTAHLRHTFGNQVNYMCFILTCGDVAEGPGMGTKLGGRCLVDTVDGGPPSQVNIMEKGPCTDAMAHDASSSLIS